MTQPWIISERPSQLFAGIRVGQLRVPRACWLDRTGRAAGRRRDCRLAQRAASAAPVVCAARPGDAQRVRQGVSLSARRIMQFRSGRHRRPSGAARQAYDAGLHGHPSRFATSPCRPIARPGYTADRFSMREAAIKDRRTISPVEKDAEFVICHGLRLVSSQLRPLRTA